MEATYRLKKLIEVLMGRATKREIFLGLDLGSPSEQLLRGSASMILKELGDAQKREFVLVVGPGHV